jgi:hypothetical protein
MNEKDELYDAIKTFADGDDDVYACLKKEIYTLTHTDNAAKFRSTVAMILFFTNHNNVIQKAINNYISYKNIDGIITVY